MPASHELLILITIEEFIESNNLFTNNFFSIITLFLNNILLIDNVMEYIFDNSHYSFLIPPRCPQLLTISTSQSLFFFKKKNIKKRNMESNLFQLTTPDHDAFLEYG